MVTLLDAARRPSSSRCGGYRRIASELCRKVVEDVGDLVGRAWSQSAVQLGPRRPARVVAIEARLERLGGDGEGDRNIDTGLEPHQVSQAVPPEASTISDDPARDVDRDRRAMGLGDWDGALEIVDVAVVEGDDDPWCARGLADLVEGDQCGLLLQDREMGIEVRRTDAKVERIGDALVDPVVTKDQSRCADHVD
jgi:hypothetical protein